MAAFAEKLPEGLKREFFLMVADIETIMADSAEKYGTLGVYRDQRREADFANYANMLRGDAEQIRQEHGAPHGSK